MTVMTRSAPLSAMAPVVWVRLAVPRKVRSAPRVTALVKVVATEASRLPPLTVSVPVPNAAFAPVISVPAERVVPPVKVLAPLSFNVPAPALERPKPAPETMPPSESVLLETVMVRLAPRVMAPVDWLRLAVPVKVRLPPKAIGLVIAAEAFRESSVPPLRLSAPGVPPPPPKANVAELAISVPEAPRVVAPV